MNKNFQIIALIAASLLIGFTVVSCGSPPGDDGLQAIESWLRSW